jgi:hypothetical protein
MIVLGKLGVREGLLLLPVPLIDSAVPAFFSRYCESLSKLMCQRIIQVWCVVTGVSAKLTITNVS